MYVSSSGENEENEEGESSSVDELTDCSDMSGNYSHAGCIGNAKY